MIFDVLNRMSLFQSSDIIRIVIDTNIIVAVSLPESKYRLRLRYITTKDDRSFK